MNHVNWSRIGGDIAVSFIYLGGALLLGATVLRKGTIIINENNGTFQKVGEVAILYNDRAHFWLTSVQITVRPPELFPTAGPNDRLGNPIGSGTF